MTNPYSYYSSNIKMKQYYLLERVMLDETIEDFVQFHKKDPNYKPPTKNIFKFEDVDSNTHINNFIKVNAYIDFGDNSVQFSIGGEVIYDFYFPSDTTHFLYDEFLSDRYSTFIAPIPTKIRGNSIYYYDGEKWVMCNKVGTRVFYKDQIKSIDDILKDSIKPRYRTKPKLKKFCDAMFEYMDTYHYNDKNMESMDNFIMQTIGINQDVLKDIFEERLPLSCFISNIGYKNGESFDVNGNKKECFLNALLAPLIKLSPLFKETYNEIILGD